MGMQMPCGNTAALNNYETQQYNLDRQPAFADSTDIARELMSGGTYSNCSQSWSMENVINYMVECDKFRAVIKRLASNIDYPKHQIKDLEELNRIIQEYSICVAEQLES